MLRRLVLAFALLNVGLYFWIHSDPSWLQGERDPQRLAHEVAPQSIAVLPDLPAPAQAASAAAPTAAPGASAASAPAPVSSAAASAPGRAAPTGSGLARKTSAEDVACVESEPLSALRWAELGQALAHAGVPASAISERREIQPVRWIVYMGRYADELQWQHKADELKRLGLKFERIDSPPTLAPGLSLGAYASAEDAGARLDELSHHGVHTARVVERSATTLRHMQVRDAEQRWRSGVSERFSACPAAPAASV